ncbi:hypothetical protein [Colwellia sp. Bg11-28]|uniref:hypothetical protein n=1 Tax=Colwellia sp. Bg11-28 TaxID=2058305 RepID=UPI000C32770C|nr:hypothetical protein [Colwellia sp. Bg11-28]PKH87911.1 hypothetical protein CXF79_14940 [Colwellia sp. Bg11-28]
MMISKKKHKGVILNNLKRLFLLAVFFNTALVFADTAPTVSGFSASSDEAGKVTVQFSSNHSSGKVKNTRLHWANNASYTNSKLVDVGSYSSTQNDGSERVTFDASSFHGERIFLKLEIKSPSGSQLTPPPNTSLLIPELVIDTAPTVSGFSASSDEAGKVTVQFSSNHSSGKVKNTRLHWANNASYTNSKLVDVGSYSSTQNDGSERVTFDASSFHGERIFLKLEIKSPSGSQLTPPPNTSLLIPELVIDTAPTVSGFSASSDEAGKVTVQFSSNHSSGKVKNTRLHWANNASYTNSKLVDVGSYSSTQNDGSERVTFDASSFHGERIFLKLEIKSPSGSQLTPPPNTSLLIPELVIDTAPTVSGFSASSDEAGKVTVQFSSNHSSGKVKNTRLHWANNASYTNSKLVDVGSYSSTQNDGSERVTFDASSFHGERIFLKLEIKSPSGSQLTPAPSTSIIIPELVVDTAPSFKFHEFQAGLTECITYTKLRYCIKAGVTLDVIINVVNQDAISSVRLLKNKSDSNEVISLRPEDINDGIAKFSFSYNKEQYLSADINAKNITIVIQLFNKLNNLSDEKELTIRLYDYEWFLNEEAKLNQLILARDNYSNELSLLTEDYLNNCSDKIYASDFSGELIPNDKRRITLGENIYQDFGQENINTYNSSVNGNPYSIKVEYDYRKKASNYPALVDVEFDITGSPNYFGTRNKLSLEVNNFKDKELAKKLLLQQVYTAVVDSACSNEVLLESEALFQYETDLSELVSNISGLSNREINTRRLLFGDELIDIALDIASGTDKQVALENVFDAFATFDIEKMLMLMLSEHPFDKLIFDFIDEGTYVDSDDLDTLMALYHISRFQMDRSYIIPNDRNYILIAESHYFSQGLEDAAYFLFSILTESLGGIPQTHGSMFAVLKPGFTKISKIGKEELVITTKQATKMLITKRGALRFSSKRGIKEHKRWENNALYDNKYGGTHKHEFSVKIPEHLIPTKGRPKSYRFDAIQFDESKNKIVIRELKPNNYKAVARGQKQLESYKEVIEYMKKNGGIPNSGANDWISDAKVIIEGVDTYSY